MQAYQTWSQSNEPDAQIAALEAALQAERQILKWPLPIPRRELRGSMLGSLGNAYADRRKESRADDLEAAIDAYEKALTIFTREEFPQEWAWTQNNLATVYINRIRGNRSDNMEAAINAAEAALTLLTRAKFSSLWAQAQNNLAIAYVNRIQGTRADNVEAAIRGHEAALSVFTRAAFPVRWAETQLNLAVAYFERIRGARATNLEAAIKRYRAALSVFTRAEYPVKWASAQNNLGNAYAERIEGRASDNLEAAIDAYEAALTVRTREAFPQDWAQTQTNLASAYALSVRDDQGDNLEAAIDAYEAALTVLTPAGFSQDWARTQHNLGNAYVDRVHGKRSDNLELAIKAYKAALTVRTREAFPRNYLQTSSLLGQILVETGQLAKAERQLANARSAFLLLFGQGLNEAEAQQLLTEAGSLFSEAAFVAAEQGELQNAFDLLAEGKARLMAVALRLDSLDLPPKKQARLAELRTEIREQSATQERTTVAEGQRALQKLISLRRELLGLIEAADDAEAVGSLDTARALVPEGGVLAAPIISGAGGKILLLGPGSGDPQLSAVDLPKMTTATLNELVLGAEGSGNGWLDSFQIQYLPEAERRIRWREWVGAIETIGGDLWHLFGSKLQTALVERGVKPGARLIWMPSGALGLLPIGLTGPRDGKPRLGDLYNITVVPSVEALAAADERAKAAGQASLAAIVNPTGDLPFTETESAFIAQHFPTSRQTRLDDDTALPSNVLAALKGKSYWHFASHGKFDWSNARQSGLLMKDKQPLTIQGLLERGDRLGNPRLVVLSACETGLFDIGRNPDEFVGLPATFMQVGAAGVVSTLWLVDDLATSFLMTRFYELHLDDGLAPPTALKRAKQWLRTATKAELIAYAKTAGAKAGLDVAMLSGIEEKLKSRRRSGDARFSVAWNVMQAKAEQALQAIGKIFNERENLQSRPFAHPYYWGGFVYTGL